MATVSGLFVSVVCNDVLLAKQFKKYCLVRMECDSKGCDGLRKSGRMEWINRRFWIYSHFFYCLLFSQISQKTRCKNDSFCVSAIWSYLFFVVPNNTKSICIFCGNYWLRNCLGKYDGNSLFDGRCGCSKRALWGLYGNYKYDDCYSNDYPKPVLWLHFKELLG